MSLYSLARSAYRRLRRIPLLAPLVERLRNLLVSGGRTQLLANATLEQGRQLASTRGLVELHEQLLDAHAQALAGLQQANAALLARIGQAEARHDDLTQRVFGTAGVAERVEFVRQETLFELRKALALRPPGTAPTQIPARILNAEKLAQAGPRRVNLGCGHVALPEMINVDARALPGVDVVADVGGLPFEADSLDEVFAAHLLEHFPARYALDVLLPHWLDKLRPGGTLRLVVPDAAAMLEDWRGGAMSFEDLALVTFGGQDYGGDFHYAMFTPATLRALLEQAGLQAVELTCTGRRNGLCREMEARGVKA